jgi:hypothetical protein
MTLQEKILLILGCLTFLAVIFLIFLVRYSDFSHELKYLNCEIQRSTEKEREYYKKRKRRLILSFFFPFIKY